jgi:hypothetical protein
VKVTASGWVNEVVKALLSVPSTPKLSMASTTAR